MCGVADTAIYAEKPGGSKKDNDTGGGWSAGAGASRGIADGEEDKGSREAEMMECTDGDNGDQEVSNEGLVECDSTDTNSAADQSVPDGPSKAENMSPSDAENVDKNPKGVRAKENMEEAVSSTQDAGASSDVERAHGQQTASETETT